MSELPLSVRGTRATDAQRLPRKRLTGNRLVLNNRSDTRRPPCATWWENINLALVKQCLGHKSIGSTMKYVGLTDSQATAAAQAALMWLY